MKKVITRFAPSPTGYIHIGNLRSAIYPYLMARQTGGKYILRIEDTDRARYVEGATELIMETLQWLGLEWDEGPDIGGPNGPYYQTERMALYHEWAQKLIAKGMAYADPTSPEQIEEYRKDAAAKKEAFLYRNYRPENTPEWEPGLPLRFRANPKRREWVDPVYGPTSAGPEVQDDIILIKRDGLPTYNFGHIVDDATMGVNYLFRGQEYLSSMANYMALYEALDLEPPVMVHMPHILRPDGRKKLGKRDGAKSATDYRDEGILAEAMLNFLACLGWNDGTEQEIYTKADLVEKFSIDRIQRAGARFDEAKLLWLNGQWIRSLDREELFERCQAFWPVTAEGASDELKHRVLDIIYDRLKVLGDLRDMTEYFFADPKVDKDIIVNNKFLSKFGEQELADMLRVVATGLSGVADWNADEIQVALNGALEATGRKPGELFSLVRIAVSFASFSPALNDTLAVLGREVTLARLNRVIAVLSD
jgi:glutamyl-tRNA synthetase